MNIFFEVGMNLPLTSETNCQKYNSKLEVVQYFFLFFKMAKTVFDLKNSKENMFASFSSFLALEQNKEQIQFQVKSLKMQGWALGWSVEIHFDRTEQVN